jgi:putative (di)nucleoside polyphosphate hydrolase
MSEKPYRFNVGIALFNAQGQVFLGKSMTDGPEYVLPGAEWQMPQGGIDPQEDIIAAARRELQEETGITKAQFLAVTDEWWRYDFPPHEPTGHRLEAYAGQQQRWAAFRFEGSDEAINLTGAGDGFQPEFTQWRWATLTEAVSGVIFYKKANYERMAEAFADFAKAAII